MVGLRVAGAALLALSVLLLFVFGKPAFQDTPRHLASSKSESDGQANHDGPEGNRKGDQDHVIPHPHLIESHGYGHNENQKLYDVTQ